MIILNQWLTDMYNAIHIYIIYTYIHRLVENDKPKNIRVWHWAWASPRSCHAQRSTNVSAFFTLWQLQQVIKGSERCLASRLAQICFGYSIFVADSWNLSQSPDACQILSQALLALSVSGNASRAQERSIQAGPGIIGMLGVGFSLPTNNIQELQNSLRSTLNDCLPAFRGQWVFTVTAKVWVVLCGRNVQGRSAWCSDQVDQVWQFGSTERRCAGGFACRVTSKKAMICRAFFVQVFCSQNCSMYWFHPHCQNHTKSSWCNWTELAVICLTRVCLSSSRRL